MLEQTAAALEDTVRLADKKLRALTDEATNYRPTPDRWTIKQVVGHLVDSASNNHHRFIRAQSLDALVFPKYDQNAWVDKQNYDAIDWGALLNLWTSYNGLIAHVIRQIPVEQLQTSCTIGDYEAVTLQFLIEDYVDHLKHHLRKIAERLDDEWTFLQD